MSQVNGKRNFTACCIGLLVMIGLSMACVLLLPVFILNEYFSVEYTNTFIIILMVAIAFTGSLVASLCEGEGAGVVPALTVFAYYVLLSFISITFFDGLSMQSVYAIIGGGIGYSAAWILLKKRKTSRSKRKKRKGNR